MGYRIGFFDLWQPDYGAAIVTVYVAGTTTLAGVFTDEALTVAASNPQTLDEKTVETISYGKWQQPLYTGQSIELSIDTGDRTGIIRPPIYSLDDQDGSDLFVTTTGGSAARKLEDRFADVIYAEDDGIFGALAATNNTILEAAIGRASARVGAEVILPSGNIPFTDLTIPGGVVLKGNGRGITVLECATADKCITIGGEGAGLRRLTLDGLNLTPTSTGLFAKGKNNVVLDDAEVKRFDTGVHFQGGREFNWRQFFLDDCNTGAKLHGDEDFAGGADGDEFRNNAWRGGLVTNCLDVGVDLSFEDLKCWHNEIAAVGFEDNAGIALKINGARHTRLPGIWFRGNTTNMDVNDDDDTDNDAINTVVGLHVSGAAIEEGELVFAGLCQDVEFTRCEITGVAITLTEPVNNIVARDCIEDAEVVIAGTGYRWTRYHSQEHSASAGITTDATATPAWSYELSPGQVGYFTAVVVGNQRNDEKTAEYHISQSAIRPGSELDYDLQTVNWTLGEIITGSTSEATARIVADTDAGGSGTLTLRDIDGEFINNEPLTGDQGGAARCVGTLTGQDAALLGALNSIRAAREDVAGWNALFAVDGPEIRVNVVGAAGDDVEWLVHVDAVVT